MKKGFRLLPFALLAVTSSLILSSCGPNFSVEINEIDSLLTEVSKREEAFRQMDTSRLDSISKWSNNNISYLKQEYNTDTINMTLARQVTMYKAYRKVANNSRQTRGKLWEEFRITRKQLETLKKDMENGALEKDKGQKYFAEEKTATKGLLLAYDDYAAQYEKVNTEFDSIHPIVVKLVEEIKSKEADPK